MKAGDVLEVRDRTKKNLVITEALEVVARRACMYTGEVYFVELISATPPAQSVFDEKFAEQEPNIRKALLTEAQNDRIEDYFAECRLMTKWSVDEEVYQYLVKPEKEQEDAPAATEDSAPESGAESSAPAEASAVTGEPAKPEAPPAEPAAAPVESAPAPQPARNSQEEAGRHASLPAFLFRMESLL